MKIICSDDIKTDADNISTNLSEFSKLSKNLTDKINSLPNVWTGNDASSFMKKFNDDFLPSLKKFEDAFNNYNSFLKQVYPVYAALEDDYNTKINTD